MKRTLLALGIIFAASPALACDRLTLPYGAAATIDFCLYNTTATALKVDATFSAGDVKINKSEGGENNVGTLPTDQGSCYSQPLSQTELTTARVYLTYINAAAYTPHCIIIETYGNASAEHNTTADVNVIKINGTDTSSLSELSAVPSATPSLVSIIQWLYEIHRHKLTQTSSTTTLYKADSSTSLSTSSVSDDGTTFSRGKFN